MPKKSKKSAKRRDRVTMGPIDRSIFPDLQHGVDARGLQEDLIESLGPYNKEEPFCYVCGRTVCVYQRKLTWVMVAKLIKVLEEYLVTEDWAEEPKSPMGDYKKSRFSRMTDWGLIERHPAEKLYKPTRKAYDFIIGEVGVPTHLFFYGKSVIAESTVKKKCNEILRGYRSYSKLMADVMIPSSKILLTLNPKTKRKADE